MASKDRAGEKVRLVPTAGGSSERRPEDPAPVDRIFSEPKPMASDFRFGAETAAVFDDMVNRSVPFYGEIQRMSCELAADFAVPGSALYDFGCATGTTLLALDQLVDRNVRFVGIDNSDEMLAKARQKLAVADSGRRIDLVNVDLNSTTTAAVDDASVALLLLTLQFVRPLHRDRLVRRIAQGLRENGALIMIEKITGSHTMLNRLFIKHYYDYKRAKGYSDLEIAQKREALENVLIPYHYEENRDMLAEAGFRHVERFFTWYNFCGIVAVK
ncbi:MAG TPA: carboxy-S-adenosyl-L-methionine synthase CmoA [Kiloniellales bacterium]